MPINTNNTTTTRVAAWDIIDTATGRPVRVVRDASSGNWWVIPGGAEGIPTQAMLAVRDLLNHELPSSPSGDTIGPVEHLPHPTPTNNTYMNCDAWAIGGLKKKGYANVEIKSPPGREYWMISTFGDGERISPDTMLVLRDLLNRELPPPQHDEALKRACIAATLLPDRANMGQVINTLAAIDAALPESYRAPDDDRDLVERVRGLVAQYETTGATCETLRNERDEARKQLASMRDSHAAVCRVRDTLRSRLNDAREENARMKAQLKSSNWL